MSNYCLNCGSLVPAGKKFCPVCGDPIADTNTQQTAKVSFPPAPSEADTLDFAPIENSKPVPVQEGAKTISVQQPKPQAKKEPAKQAKEKKPNFFSNIFFEEVEVEDEPETAASQNQEKKHSVLPMILLVLLAVLIGAFGFLYFEKPSVLNKGLNAIGLGLPGYSEKTTAAASASATAAPAASATAAATSSAATTTAAAASTSKGTVTITLDTINIRDTASTTGNAVGQVTKGASYTVLATASGEGYTWYEIGQNQWIADSNGEWVTYKAN